jgi:DnaJ-class molecular chaperone
MTPEVAYEILGLEYGSSAQKVWRRYYQLAKENHPDKNPDDPEAEKRMKEINYAFERLNKQS